MPRQGWFEIEIASPIDVVRSNNPAGRHAAEFVWLQRAGWEFLPHEAENFRSPRPRMIESELSDHAHETLANLGRERGELWVMCGHGLRGIDRNDGRATAIALVDDDIARQHHSDLEHQSERLVSERRVARAEDLVAAKVDVELLLQRRSDVDLGQDTEALGLERRRKSSQGLFVADREVFADPWGGHD